MSDTNNDWASRRITELENTVYVLDLASRGYQQKLEAAEAQLKRIAEQAPLQFEAYENKLVAAEKRKSELLADIRRLGSFGDEQQERAEKAESRVMELEMGIWAGEAPRAVCGCEAAQQLAAEVKKRGEDSTSESKQQIASLVGTSESNVDLRDKCERLSDEYRKLRSCYLKAENLLREWLVDAEGFCPAAQSTRAFLSGQPTLKAEDFDLQAGSRGLSLEEVIARYPEAAQSVAEHVVDCRYEKEFPLIDPEDCPRCQHNETEREGLLNELDRLIPDVVSRTEAEQLLLNLLSVAKIGVDPDGEPCFDECVEEERICYAELARRNTK
jgi:hypothetical protein